MGDISIVNPTTKDIPNQFYYIDLESVTGGVLSKLIIVNKSEAPSRAQRVVETGDVLFQTVRPYQQNNYLVSGEFELPVVASTGYAQIRTEENQRFLYSLLHTKSFLNEVLLRCTGSSYPAINSNDLKEISTFIPERKEQKRIAELMQLLEERIAKQRQLVEALKSYKRGALSKLFPKKGETTPEYRFAGFTEPWEQQKWCDTVDMSKEMVDPRNGTYNNLPHVAPGNIESFTGRLFDNVKTVEQEELISGKFHFHAGDIIYCKINPQLGKYYFAQFEGLTSADAYVLNAKNGVIQDFLFAVLQTKDFFDYSVSVSKRSGMPKINREELNAYLFLAPSELEQEQIGAFLMHLDHLISAQRSRIDEYERMKAGLLQQLFI